MVRITAFQRDFVIAYIKCGSLTDAYIKAKGTSTAKRSTIATNASRLFAMPHVRNYYYRQHDKGLYKQISDLKWKVRILENSRRYYP